MIDVHRFFHDVVREANPYNKGYELSVMEMVQLGEIMKADRLGQRYGISPFEVLTWPKSIVDIFIQLVAVDNQKREEDMDAGK